jgi:hypothetical protein
MKVGRRRTFDMESIKHVYEIRPSKNRRTFELISNVLPLGRTGGFVDAAGAARQAKSYSGSHPAVIRIYDDAGNVIETLEHHE